MCCGNIWKRAISFLLAFLLGIYIAKLFLIFTMPLESLENKVSPPKLEYSNFQTEKQNPIELEKKLKCLPADSNLKYHFLSDDGLYGTFSVNEKEYKEINELIELRPKTKNETESNKIDEKLANIFNKKIEEVEKVEKELRKHNDSPKANNLLHVEKCYEIK